MLVARPLVVGVDEIWRPTQPRNWGVQPWPFHSLPPPGLHGRQTAPFLGSSITLRPPLPGKAAVPWVLGPEFDWLGTRPQCSACRIHPVLEFLLQQCPRSGGVSRSSAAPPDVESWAAEPISEPAVSSSSVPPSEPAVSATLAAVVASVALPAASERRPQSDGSDQQVAQPDLQHPTRSLPNAGSERQDGPSVDELAPIMPRQDSEWSLLSFSSLRTVESIDLSEEVDPSDSESRGRSRRSAP